MCKRGPLQTKLPSTSVPITIKGHTALFIEAGKLTVANVMGYPLANSLQSHKFSAYGTRYTSGKRADSGFNRKFNYRKKFPTTDDCSLEVERIKMTKRAVIVEIVLWI